MQENIDIKEHTENIVRAITALMPSRNYIVQFLAMLPADYTTMYDAYPEMFKDEKTKKALEMAFGVSFGDKVEIRYTNNLSHGLINFYREIFRVLEYKEIAQGLAQLTEANEKEIPDLWVEWVELRLRGLAIEPNYRQEVRTVLKAIIKIIEEEEITNKYINLYDVSVTRIAKTSNIEEKQINYVIDLLSKYKLIEKGYAMEIRLPKYLKYCEKMIDRIFK